jgi:hypothetical protein
MILKRDKPYLALCVLEKLFLGRHFSPVLSVSRYTSSDAGCSILDAG